MPLSKLQSQILRLLAGPRDPKSSSAGSTPLNLATWRTSDDIDIFHDRAERVAHAALEDSAILQTAGLEIVWLRRQPAIYTAEAGRAGKRSASRLACINLVCAAPHRSCQLWLRPENASDNASKPFPVGRESTRRAAKPKRLPPFVFER